jgi:hypothetical protein
MPTRKRFELLDCPKFAFPSLTNIDVFATAANILERLGGKGFLNYGQIWPHMTRVAAGYVDEAYLVRNFNGYPIPWKNENLQDVLRLLGVAFAGKGRWYPAGTKPFEILPGAFFKPCIRGTFYSNADARAYSVCVNARKHQHVFPDHGRFLSRGVYEFHAIDDPFEPTPIPMVVDLSAGDNGSRELKMYMFDEKEMMSLDEFEFILRRFFEALVLAGVTTIPEGVENIADLFRKRRFD